MNRYLLMLCYLVFFAACKQEASHVANVDNSKALSNTDESSELPDMSKTLYASLDRLRIRTDSSMKAGTVITISERDTLMFLEKVSSARNALKLRSIYYYEPWLKVQHVASGKRGWVYGGAVKYESSELKKLISENSDLHQQIHADDLEWAGVVPTSWSTATITNPTSFKTFIIYFKDLVRLNEVAKIADLIHYPIKDIKSKEQFMDNYRQIMTDELREAVEAQRLDRIYRDRKGAIIGEDQIVFNEIGGVYKIVNMDFRSRADLAQGIMQEIADTYVAKDGEFVSIKAFVIKGFLELTLNYNDGRTKSLGKFLYESSKNKEHNFYEETSRATKQRLRIVDSNDFLELSISGSQNPNLDGLSFQAVREI